MMITQDVSDTHRRTSRGAGGGLQPPQHLGSSIFWGQWRKFGQKAREVVFGEKKIFSSDKKYFLSSHLRPAKINDWNLKSLWLAEED